MSSTNLYNTLIDSGLTQSEAQEVIDSVSSKKTDLTLLDNTIHKYNSLTSQIKSLTEELDSVKETLLTMMNMLGLKAYACQYGRVNVIDQTQRITYPKDALDAIAKQNKMLRRILNSVAKTTIVKAYVRVNPIHTTEERE